MDKLAAMRAFVAIAEGGSLTAAAIQLGKSQPSMVRSLANLEQALGTRLLRRSTRRLALTDEGRVYLEHCRRILADINEMERVLGNDHDEPRGALRLTAPVTFGRMHVAPAVVAFLQRYTRVQVEMLLLDRVVNLLEEDIDLAVRIGPLGDSSLMATGVGWMRRVTVASPALLARHGEPGHPRALADQPCVVFRGATLGPTWRFREREADISVRVRGVLTTNQMTPAVEACAADLGFGNFLAYQVAPVDAELSLEVLGHAQGDFHRRAGFDAHQAGGGVHVGVGGHLADGFLTGAHFQAEAQGGGEHFLLEQDHLDHRGLGGDACGLAAPVLERSRWTVSRSLGLRVFRRSSRSRAATRLPTVGGCPAVSQFPAVSDVSQSRYF